MKYIFIVSVDTPNNYFSPAPDSNIVENYVSMALKKYESVCKETRRVTHFDGMGSIEVRVARVNIGGDGADDLASVINRVNVIRTAWESLPGGKVEKK